MEQNTPSYSSGTKALTHRFEEITSGKPPKPAVHLLAGATGGLATAILTSPLDVLRTRLQSDLYRSPCPARATASTLPLVLSAPIRHIRETIQITHSIHSIEGWRGFYRGLVPSVIGVVPATAIKFYVYGNCKLLGAQILGCEQNAAIVHAQAAIAAGLATSTATNPIWLIKTRLQLDETRKDSRSISGRYKNSWDCVQQVLKQEGFRGLFRGLSASYLGTVETALHLVLYEQLKVVYRQSLQRINFPNDSTWNEALHWISTSGAAGTAKLGAGLIAYPHEVIRTRLRQAPTETGLPKNVGLWQCFQSVAKYEGIAGLYGGLIPHLVRSIPSAIITLGFYEFVLRFYNA